MTDFVHLHVHSDFSLQDAAVSVMSLADRAEELGMSHLALTDHGNMFGAMEFISACEETLVDKERHEKRKRPVKPIIGCEMYVSPLSRFDKKGTENDNRYYHLVLLAANREGYFNLVRLCSLAYTEGFYYRPRIDEELLAQYHNGLIALSACASGEIPRLIQAGNTAGAEEKARQYRDLFGFDEKGNPNFYLEIMDHGIPADVLRGGLSQDDLNKAIIAISGRTGIPLVATNDVHYLRREDSVAHDVLLCVGTGKVRTEEKRKRYYGDQFYLKSGDEMAALFPENPEAIANTVRIAERCVTDIPRVDKGDLHKYLPDVEIPPGFDNAGLFLRHLAYEGLARCYAAEKREGGKAWEDIQKRCEYELSIIIDMGYTGYLLIVADFINWAKEHGIPVGPGRGSGAGSIVAYSLRITEIDPLKYKLLFERFLNPERISMPDFDIDFANEGRDEVIKYVIEKYGRERAAQIITFGTLGAKTVIKDVARVLGISIPESEMITKLIPKDPKITLQKAIDSEPRLGELEQDPRYVELFALARKLEGLNRNSSIHAAGVVIGKTPLMDFVPLYKDPKKGGIATQYSMNYLEPCGLVKMDFLGLKTLDVIKHTEELIRIRGGGFANFSITEIPENDEATFKMLGEGKSFEVFQFESDGMQNTLRRAKPNSIEDLIALNSLYRPGPMDNIGQYIDSKLGRQAISYPDPSLEEVLKETYGVIVYQEQVMQVARIIAGYSLSQADLLRRAMGKKKKEILDKEKIPFLEGAAKQGYSPEKAGEVYDILVPFAGYGFNKSHAAAYSVIAYQTAYLKMNFPAEFMAASLTNEIDSQDKDKLSVCITECGKMGLAIDPPDINRSDKLFSVVDGCIVYGFLGIKHLGALQADEIINVRHSGPYRDFMDFLNRIDIKAVGKGVIEKLILTGAFDRLGTSRETLLGNLERAIEYVLKIKEDKKYGQASLFGDTGEKEYPDFEYENFPAKSRAEKLKSEKELIGFYFSGHPMDEYRDIWKRMVKVNLGAPETLPVGNRILIGLVKNIRPFTKSTGEKMAFAILEDYNGEIELAFFYNVWKKCQDRIENDKIAFLKGVIKYQSDRDKYTFIVDECFEEDELDKAAKEEESQNRKWDKYRNVEKFSKELGISFLDLGAPLPVDQGPCMVIGIVKSLRTFIGKNNKEMAFCTIRDQKGEIDLVFFDRIWDSCKSIIAADEMLAFKGTVKPPRDPKQEKPSFIVSSIQDINRLVRMAAKKANEFSARDQYGISGDEKAEKNSPIEEVNRVIHIRLADEAVENEDKLYSLRDLLAMNPGTNPVFIHVPARISPEVSMGSVSLGSTPAEVIIKVSENFNAGVSASNDTFTKCSAVADVWTE